MTELDDRLVEHFATEASAPLAPQPLASRVADRHRKRQLRSRVVGGILTFAVVVGASALLFDERPVPGVDATNQVAATLPTAAEPADPTAEPAGDLFSQYAESEHREGVEIGNGPNLEWRAVAVPGPDGDFVWLDNGFSTLVRGQGILTFTPDGDASRTALPVMPKFYEAKIEHGIVVATNASVADPILLLVDGSWLSIEVPTDVVPIDDPHIALAATYEVAFDDGELVVVRTIRSAVDFEALFAEAGVTVPEEIDEFDVKDSSIGGYADGRYDLSTTFAELGLSDAQIAALRIERGGETTVFFGGLGTEPVESAEFTGATLEPRFWGQSPLSVTGGQFFFDESLGDGIHRSDNGAQWTRLVAIEGGDPGLTTGASNALVLQSYNRSGPTVRRSIDGGSTWLSTPYPGVAPRSLAAVNDVIALAGFASDPWAANGESVRVERDGYALDLQLSRIDDGAFTLTNLATGLVVLEGDESTSDGVDFDELTRSITFSNPESGEIFVVFEEDDFNDEMLQAAASASPADAMIWLAQVPFDTDEVVWGASTVAETFGADALLVHFVAGEGALLAVVETEDGPALYIADIS